MNNSDPLRNAGDRASFDAETVVFNSSRDSNAETVAFENPRNHRAENSIVKSGLQRSRVDVAALGADVYTVATKFEQTWTPKRSWTIENALESVPFEKRGSLFSMLVEVDIALGFANDVPVSENEYKARFPQWSDKIERAYRNALLDSDVMKRSRIGKRIDKYRVESVIGQGGMGVVYKAFDEPFNRYVAIKYLAADGGNKKENVEFFRREMETLGAQKNPCFAAAYNSGVDGGFYYFVMEYIEGEDLAKYRKRAGRLEWHEAGEYVRQIARGLRAIHEQGIVHRDVKPENVMRQKNGVIRILDLGLALWKENSALSVVENDDFSKNYVVGTPAYISPEGMYEPELVDAQSDLYSLGGLFFFLLTGKLPTERFDPASNDSVKPLKLFFPERSRKESYDPEREKLFRILEKLFEPDRDKRYKTADQALNDLDDALDGRPNPQRNDLRAGVALGALACVLLLLVFVARCTPDRSNAPDRKLVDRAAQLAVRGQSQKAFDALNALELSQLDPKLQVDAAILRSALANELANSHVKRAAARKDLELALKVDPKNVDALLLDSELAIRNDDAAGALEKLKQIDCEQIDKPRAFQAKFLKALANFKLKEYKTVAGIFDSFKDELKDARVGELTPPDDGSKLQLAINALAWFRNPDDPCAILRARLEKLGDEANERAKEIEKASADLDEYDRRDAHFLRCLADDAFAAARCAPGCATELEKSLLQKETISLEAALNLQSIPYDRIQGNKIRFEDADNVVRELLKRDPNSFEATVLRAKIDVELLAPSIDAMSGKNLDDVFQEKLGRSFQFDEIAQGVERLQKPRDDYDKKFFLKAAYVALLCAKTENDVERKRRFAQKTLDFTKPLDVDFSDTLDAGDGSHIKKNKKQLSASAARKDANKILNPLR